MFTMENGFECYSFIGRVFSCGLTLIYLHTLYLYNLESMFIILLSFKYIFCFQFTQAREAVNPKFPTVHLDFSMPYECKILQALFPHYLSQKYHISFWLHVYIALFLPLFLETYSFVLFYVLLMVFLTFLAESHLGRFKSVFHLPENSR